MAITVVGSVALDTVETPFGKIEMGLGGAASHFSSSSSFFTKINLVGVVGSDFPQEHIEFFKSRDIDVEGLEIIEGGKSFFWAGRYDHDLNVAHTLDTQLNVFETFEPKLPDSYKSPNILFLANIHPNLQLHVAECAGKPGFIATDTMNLWIENEREALGRVIAITNLLTINEGEARLITKEYNLVKAAKKIQDMGPETVVIKRGEYGCLLFHGDKIFNAPAYPLENIFDPTGAGDSFAGGMMGYLDHCGEINYENLKTAVICGSAMASYQVEKFSNERIREINKEDIRRRFEEFEHLGSFETMRI